MSRGGRARAWLALALSLLIASAAAAPAAAAPRAPLLGVSDGRILAAADPELRASARPVLGAAGARIGRLPVAWSSFVDAPGFVRPSEVERPLSDPEHPAYRWERLDAALRDLTAAGVEPLLYLMAAPTWARSAPHYAYAAPGTWAPRPTDLAAFASALARRYDGTFIDPRQPGAALPRVRRFQSWNEPNLALYLQPQWVPAGGKHQLFSPRWYRRMHRAVHNAIHARQPDAEVGLAGLAPTGAGQDGDARVAPMRFLRSLWCIDRPRQGDCAEPLPVDAVALHPLSVGDPDRSATGDDLALAGLDGRLRALAGRAVAQRRLTRRSRPPLWVTELNWSSAGASAIRADRQAVVLGRGVRRLWEAGARLVLWQFLADPPTTRTFGYQRPAGLTTALAGDPLGRPGTPKPFLRALAFPIVALPVCGRAYVWALPPRGGASAVGGAGASSVGAGAEVRVRVEVRRGGRWRIVGRDVARGGVVELLVPARRGERLRVKTDQAASPSIPVVGRLRRLGPGKASRSATLPEDGLTVVNPSAPDPRPADPDGPGSFVRLPPIVPGGTPPAANGRRLLPVERRARSAGPAEVRRLPGSPVVVGSRGADRIAARGALVTGLGGDDTVSGAARCR